MNDREFEMLEKIDEGHWWFRGKRLILQSLLAGRDVAGRMADLGCGTGGMLVEWGDRVDCVGVDRSQLALRISRDRGVEALVRSELDRLPFATGSFSTLLILDVIEHLEDDVSFLRSARDLCSSEGSVIISVPAFQMLWSRHDETFEHLRRYNRSSLDRVVREAGLVPVRSTYTNFFAFPPAALWRLATSRLLGGRMAPETDFFSLPAPVNALLVSLYRLEAWLLRRFDLPVGLSVVCIATRSAD